MRRTHFGIGLIAVLGVAVLSAAAASCLPDKAYQRFQLVDGTIFGSVRWIYERVHFDPRPVDVAIVGPSRTVLGLSAARVQQRLTQLGKPANVANFSVIAAGRNLEWAIVDELFKAKSPKVIVVGIDESPNPFGHPAFKYIAPARAIAAPPTPLLHDYLYDVAYLPFRQMKLFAASWFPDLFGLRTRFDPASYARARTDFTTSHRLEDGKWIEMGRQVPRETLLAEKRRYAASEKHSRVPRAIARLTEGDDRVYIGEIAREARAHGARLVFVYMPIFDGPPLAGGGASYRRYGEVQDNGDLADRDRLFQGWAHLNHAGAMIASDRLADAIAPGL